VSYLDWRVKAVGFMSLDGPSTNLIINACA